MEYFLQQAINGLTLGAIYGLIAIGYTMVYGIIGMINFAHGEVFMIGSFLTVIFITVLGSLGIHPTFTVIALILLLVIPFTGVWGWSVERAAYRPLRGSFRLAPLISAIGMSIFLQNLVQFLQGARNKPIPVVVPGGFTLLESDGFPVQVRWLQIVIVVMTIALMIALTYLIHRTRFGRAQRACEQDMKMAMLLGIDVNRTISATFVLGAGLAGIAGVMVAYYYNVVNFYDGFLAGLKAFTAAVLGGIGSVPGAMLGGVLLGLIEAMWSAYFSIEYKDFAAFSILVLVLIFRPTGILGRPEIEKV